MTARDMYYILDKQGNPQPARSGLEWGQWFGRSWPQRAVAQIVIPFDRTHRIFISAVFLGMNHNWFDKEDDRPILYEMMVFYEQFNRPRGRGQRRLLHNYPRVKQVLDTYQRRYRTHAEAKADFDEMVRYLLTMKKVWYPTPPDTSALHLWCDVYDTLASEEEEHTSSASSQNENTKEL